MRDFTEYLASVAIAEEEAHHHNAILDAVEALMSDPEGFNEGVMGGYTSKMREALDGLSAMERPAE